MKRMYPVKNKKSLRENLQEIIPLVFDDIMMFKKIVSARPLAKIALHEMRKKAKPLRYAMEIGETAFGEEFAKCLAEIKDTLELLGDIHDADVMIPEIEIQVREIRLFNVTLPVYKERISTKGLRNIATELRAKRKELYVILCRKLNLWERRNFKRRLIMAMGPRGVNPAPDAGLKVRKARVA